MRHKAINMGESGESNKSMFHKAINLATSQLYSRYSMYAKVMAVHGVVGSCTLFDLVSAVSEIAPINDNLSNELQSVSYSAPVV